MHGHMLELSAECLPDIIIASPASRIAGFYAELEVLEDLEPAVSECHLRDRTVVDAAVAGDIRFPVDQAVLAAARYVPVQRLLERRAIREVERDNHLVVQQLGKALAVLDDFRNITQKPVGRSGVDPDAWLGT